MWPARLCNIGDFLSCSTMYDVYRMDTRSSGGLAASNNSNRSAKMSLQENGEPGGMGDRSVLDANSLPLKGLAMLLII